MVAQDRRVRGTRYRWFNDEEFSVNLYGGLAYSVEQYRTHDDARGVEALIGSELHYQLSPTSRFSQRVVAYPDSVNGGARFALQLAVLQKYREKVSDQNAHSDTVFLRGLRRGSK